MKVRMLKGSDAGEIRELSASEAKRLVMQNAAEPVATKPSENAETR